MFTFVSAKCGPQFFNGWQEHCTGVEPCFTLGTPELKTHQMFVTFYYDPQTKLAIIRQVTATSKACGWPVLLEGTVHHEFTLPGETVISTITGMFCNIWGNKSIKNVPKSERTQSNWLTTTMRWPHGTQCSNFWQLKTQLWSPTLHSLLFLISKI